MPAFAFPSGGIGNIHENRPYIPPILSESMYNLPPLGLINLATALKGLSHRVVVMDFVLAIRQGALKRGRDIYDDCEVNERSKWGQPLTQDKTQIILKHYFI